MRANSKDKIKDIMNDHVIKVLTSTDQQEVAKILQELDLLAVPVVDKENHLMGLVSFDDAMDILEEELTEDIYDKAGLASMNKKEFSRSAKLIDGSFFQIWSVRLPFLVITLIGGVTTGLIANIWQPVEGLGIDVGQSLGLTMTIATTFGFLIPFMLQKFNIDQAAGADPIITTIKDISGLIIYFFLVSHFLGHLM
ncbi:magnesium transporter [Isachenkonia alkalipeptolytica]|uniref:Magnesium transporter n=1 Tax=Isachenkonia alkalipeptolytica TaxID=2565777 RepID=A0AA43XIT6_9CLOT|nr:magnesium transporter [Isachenkonia alkalipeptolytica]NBG87066.1 magnesium transporter [Isachenkonia alkalipeptolytica]